jgi:acetyl esterase/lipase
MAIIAALLTLMMLAAADLAAESGRDYPAVSSAVTFDDVMALPVGKPAARFGYGPGPSQFAELWLPAGEGSAPVVAFVHGGCWLSEYNIRHSHALATALSREGLAVWNIEYRRVGEAGGGFPGSLDDVKAALAMLRESPPAGTDPKRLALAGHSAGGHLALLAADNIPTVALAPIIDLATYAAGTGSCNAAASRFIGAPPDARPKAYRAATPTLQATDTVLMGTLDAIVPAEQAYLPPARDAWPEAGHFDWIHPGTPAWQEVRAALQRALQ